MYIKYISIKYVNCKVKYIVSALGGGTSGGGGAFHPIFIAVHCTSKLNDTSALSKAFSQGLGFDTFCNLLNI